MKFHSCIEPLESRIAPAVFIVNTLSDSIDSPGSATVSLRDAIAAANAHPGADTITFKPGLTGTITLIHGELLITDTLTIKGPANKIIVSGDSASRIFDCYDGNTAVDHPVTISGLTMIDGVGTGAYASGSGGAIFSTESLKLINSVVSGNQADGNPNGVGGGVFVNNSGTPSATVTISQCTISGNSSFSAGGGLYLLGAKSVQVTNTVIVGNLSDGNGGAAHAGTNDATGPGVKFSGDTIVGNRSSGPGGGVTLGSQGEPVSFVNSHVSGNLSADDGGGLYVNFEGTPGHATIQGSVFTGNSAPKGGGIYVHEAAALTISGVIATGNHATSGRGGGLYIEGNGSGTLETVTITGSHFDDNVAATNAGGINATGGVNLGIAGTSIDGNRAGGGGGGLLALGFGSDDLVNVKITGGDLSQNFSSGVGGGAYIPGDGTVTISGLKVTDNTCEAPNGGGGLLINSTSSVKLMNLNVSGNVALGQNGGGLDLNANGAGATFVIKGGTFSGNLAGVNGGGIYLLGLGEGSIFGAKITGNSAGNQGGGLFDDLGTPSDVILAGTTITGNVAVNYPNTFGL
jgi:predicted outer membrane repeat protein